MAVIRVWPGPGGATLVHPIGTKLKPGLAGTLWPDDAFTHRRIGEGALMTTSGGGVVSDVGAARRQLVEEKIAAEAPPVTKKK